MTDDPTGQVGADAARQLLNQSEQILRDLMRALEAATDEARLGRLPSEGDISDAVRALANVRALVIQEIQTYDKRDQLSAGVVSQDTHDLDAVRDLLGRKLDRIRDAARAGGVSG